MKRLIELLYSHCGSKKFFLTLLLVLLSFLALSIPPFLGKTIITGTEFITLMTLICGFYHGANVLQRHDAFNNPDKDKKDGMNG